MVTPTAEGLGEADTLTNNAFITDDMVDEENRLSQETERQDSKTCVTKDRSEKEDDQESKNQCYKRLVHLLNCSKFYTEFILQRLNHTKESHTKKKGGQVSSEFSTKEGSEDIPTSSQLSKISVKNELVEVDNLKSRTLREKNTNTNEDAQSNEDPQSPVRKVIAKRKRADDKHDISTFIDHQTIRDIEKRIKLEEKPAVTAKGNSNLITEEETRETAFGHIVSTRQPLLFEGGVLRDYQLEGLEWLKGITYIQMLWEVIADEGNGTNSALYNGAVEAAYTLIGAGAALGVGWVQLDWQLLGEAALALFSLLQGAALLVSSTTASLWLAYSMYVLFGVLYHTMITIANSEVAKCINEDSFALIFGVNTFFALLLQTIFTAVVVGNSGLALSTRDQYTVYGSYFLIIGAVFALMATYTACRHCMHRTRPPKAPLHSL